MSQQSILDQISEAGFFTGMGADELKLLAGFGHSDVINAGGYLIERGSPAIGFRLIVAGRVALELMSHARPHVIQTLGAGDPLGISWLVPPHVWQFTARAITDTQVIVFDTDAIREAAEHDITLHDDLVTRFLSVMARRLQATRLQVLDLYQRVET